MKQPDPLRGMTPDLRAEFEGLPVQIRRAYVQFRLDRVNRKSAHRDQLEAFVGGYYAHRNRNQGLARPA